MVLIAIQCDTIYVMDKEGVQSAIFFIFLLGCGIGFYLAKLLF